MALRKEIGRNLSAMLAPLILGISLMKFALNACRMDLEQRDSSTTSQISLPIIGHPTWKNSMVNLFGPGDFSWAMFLTISSTSSTEVGLIKLWECFKGANLVMASIILEIAPCLLNLGLESRSL